jgi:response regulator of citrate/malate metabolism
MDIKKLGAMLGDAQVNEQKIKQLSKLHTTAWNKLVEMQGVLEQMEAILGGAVKKVKPKDLPAHPKAGSAASKLCNILNSKTPMPVDKIAKQAETSEATIKQYLRHQCFQNIRGKGYIYKK